MKINALVYCALLLFPFQVQADIVLNFGVYTSDKPSSMVKKLRPLLNELEVGMRLRLQEEVHIKMQVAHSYEKGISQIVKGDVDFSRLGAASYVLAKQANDKLQIVAMEHENGKKQFFGVIAVPDNSKIRQLSDLRGKRFAFGSERSTIGRYLAQELLMKNGINSLDFKKTEYLGRHDAVGAALVNGQFDAGALKESTFLKMRTQGQGLRELVRFPNVTKSWVVRGQLSPRVFKALQQSLLALQDTPGLRRLNKSGFMPGSDTEYAITREAIRNNIHFFK